MAQSEGQDFAFSCVVNTTLERLELIERRILESQRRIARQRQLIAELEQASWDATELLRRLEELQAQHVADRERLRDELGLKAPD